MDRMKSGSTRSYLRLNQLANWLGISTIVETWEDLVQVVGLRLSKQVGVKWFDYCEHVCVPEGVTNCDSAASNIRR